MTTIDFITELFCKVDNAMTDVAKHPQAALYPSEIVTLGLLFALKGVGERAFYRWLARDYLPLFPKLPERTRLFRLFKSHRTWGDRFLAQSNLPRTGWFTCPLPSSAYRSSTSGYWVIFYPE